jgi:(E)-4-hydroxy-3-methylbut-2-enyl-diphosphate synthase
MLKYCEAVHQTRRWKTRAVQVGAVGVGGENPVRIQSMTTSNTRDVEATATQVMRLADAGCDIARVTVQGMKEAEACAAIKNTLIQRGYSIPLVADIHFYPPAALFVAECVDKVRINPGNFLDKRAQFKQIAYDDAAYEREIAKIEEGFSPLVEKCKRLGRALRIGTNHGSLSDRIMSRYGDTSLGMVESALEFARVCRRLDFHDLIFSMKASNPLVMIHAYRLLVARMIELGWDYPLHVGVTEAGDGEDGRVKSAMGIGSLLLDGIGDTIRVSLTEDPWQEIDPCKRLVAYAASRQGMGTAFFEEKERDVGDMRRRKTHLTPPLHRDGSVLLPSETLFYPKITSEDEEEWERVLATQPSVLLFSPASSRLHTGRKFFDWLRQKQSAVPVILCFAYACDWDDLVIQASAECGALLADGLGEGICLETPHDAQKVSQLCLSILQAARMRASKTEFIACPGCGRTLFNLQEVTQRIRARTGHLPGVKIAIMGCIVNGPGEMADADFGYVGSKTGKVDLYVGKTCVERGIDSADADERLIALIKQHGRWIEQNSLI